MRGLAPGTSRVRARLGAGTNPVRELPTAGAPEKPKEQSSSFSGVSVRWGCAGAFARRVSSRPQGTGGGRFPCPGKQEPGEGPTPGKNRVRARFKCRHKHGARLVRRSRANCSPQARGCAGLFPLIFRLFLFGFCLSIFFSFVAQAATGLYFLPKRK